jgi:hypothetical protein
MFFLYVVIEIDKKMKEQKKDLWRTDPKKNAPAYTTGVKNERGRRKVLKQKEAEGTKAKGKRYK